MIEDVIKNTEKNKNLGRKISKNETEKLRVNEV